MGNNTPSGRRREGRNAFSPGEDPNDVNPYLNHQKHFWGSDIYAKDWEEGWKQAEKEYNERIKTETFEIYWDDLTEQAQERFRNTMSINPDESNWDIYPMATMEIEKE